MFWRHTLSQPVYCFPATRAYTNPATGAHIFGSFLVVGDNEDFCSLTPLQLERALQLFGPQLTHHECEQIMLTHEQGAAWVELWN